MEKRLNGISSKNRSSKKGSNTNGSKGAQRTYQRVQGLHTLRHVLQRAATAGMQAGSGTMAVM